MRVFGKRLAAIAFVFVFAVFFSACGKPQEGTESTFVSPTPAPGNDSGSVTLIIAVAQEKPSPEFDAVVDAFRAENGRYTVKVINYYDVGASDMNAALDFLISDIEDGRGPDMIYLPSFLTNELSRKGHLENLYKYLDSDIELGRDSFPAGLLKSSEVSRGLYTFGSAFYIITAEGPQEVLGDMGALTYEKLRAAMGEVREGVGMLPYGMTRESFVRYSFMVSGDTFLDRNSMISNFECDEYIKILEFAEALPSGAPAAGESLLSLREIKSFSNNSSTGVYAGIPLPSGMDSGSAAVFVSEEIGIVSSSANKTVSWNLLRRFLLEKFQLQMAASRFENGASYLPTNTAALKKMAEEALPRSGVFYSQGQTTDRQDADKILALAEGLETVYRDMRDISEHHNYSPMETIVVKHAALYFEGEKSAKEAAADTGEDIRKYLIKGTID